MGQKGADALRGSGISGVEVGRSSRATAVFFTSAQAGEESEGEDRKEERMGESHMEGMIRQEGRERQCEKW